MNRSLFTMAQIPPDERARVAFYVADYTQSPAGREAQLLRQQAEDILGRRMGFVACVGNTFIGYAGVREPVDGETGIELGPFIVPAEHRRQGHGIALLTTATHAVVATGRAPYVLANAANTGNLARVGYTPTTLQDLAPETYESYPPDGNTPMVLRDPPRLPTAALDVWLPDVSLQMPELQATYTLAAAPAPY